MSDRARIVQISVSPGGVPKRPVPSARVTALGLEGDVQGDREHHGGPERALCLFSQERIRALQYSRAAQKRHPGDSRVYARVLREGSLTSGDPVQLLTEDEASSLLGAR